jgi:integrase
MKMKLTNTIVEKLAPGPDKHYEVNDAEVPGLLLRVQPTGVRVYYVRYRMPDGKRRYYRLGNAGAITVAEARIAARQYLADVVKGYDPQEAKQRPKDHTLKTFLPVYKERAPRAKAAAANITRVEHSFKDLLDKPISDIRPMWIENWQAARQRAKAAKATVNREITALRAVLGKAVDWGFIDTHPLKRVKQLKVDTGTRPRYLKPDELNRLHAALDEREEKRRAERDSFNKHRTDRNLSPLPDLRAVVFTDYLKPMTLLALNTGLRRGELFNLTWADCELEGAAPTLTVQGEGAKSGKTRHVPLNRAALDSLTRWKAQGEGTGLVFVSPKTGGRFDNISSSWDQLTEDAKLPDFRFHDCRHHFASMLVQKGIDLNTVRELLGHSDLKLTMRYAYLAPENTARAVAVLDAPANVVPMPTPETAESAG